jgi:large conductance mechanosensitive channel
VRAGDIREGRWRACFNGRSEDSPTQEAAAVKNFFKEFKEFISKGNLVEVAVAFVLGLAFKAVIDAFMTGIVNPIIGLILGKPNLDDVLTFTVRDSTISIGLVLTQIVSLIIVGFVLFLIVKAYNRMRGPQPDTGPDEIALLTEIRDELRARS